VKKNLTSLFGPGEAAAGVIALAGLYAISRYSYPAFHTIAELFSIIIGFSLFMLIWNSRRIIDNNYLIFIGIAYLFVAATDLLHALSYKGIELFAGYGTNLPTQLWIAARYLESLSLLAAPFFVHRKLNAGWFLAGYTVLFLVIMICIFQGVFPDCYKDGTGLTGFKIASEYLISVFLLCALLILLIKRKAFDPDVLFLLACSISLTIASELFFTFYVNVYGISNLVGHFLKIVSFYLIYKAIIEIGLSRPYRLLFRELQDRETSLRESEERLRFALETIHTGAWVLDLTNHNSFRSLEHDRIFGYPGMLPEWTYEMFLEHVLPEDREMVEGKFRQAMVDKSDWNFECRIRRADGAVCWIWAAGRHTQDAQGSHRRMAGIVQDITGRKHVEEDMKKQKQLLEDANRELESFSYSISHDLRAPLRAIDGFSRMILREWEDKFDEGARRRFDMIRENTQRMGVLIESLLSFSRLQKTSMNRSEINMEDLANDVWLDIIAECPHRDIDFKMTTMLPGYGDRLLIRQVFFNLLNNAVKFTRNKKPGIVEISSFIDADKVVYCIKDNGVGFDMEYYDKLFGVFQRLHSHEEFEGTGIGLAIVQRIINRHGGRIWAEGKVSEGATFFFSLPSSIS